MSVVVTGRLDLFIQTFTSAGQPLGRPVEVNAGWIACSSGPKQLSSRCDEKTKGPLRTTAPDGKGYVATRQLILGVHHFIDARHELRSIVFGRQGWLGLVRVPSWRGGLTGQVPVPETGNILQLQMRLRRRTRRTRRTLLNGSYDVGIPSGTFPCISSPNDSCLIWNGIAAVLGVVDYGKALFRTPGEDSRRFWAEQSSPVMNSRLNRESKFSGVFVPSTRLRELLLSFRALTRSASGCVKAGRSP